MELELTISELNRRFAQPSVSSRLKASPYLGGAIPEDAIMQKIAVLQKEIDKPLVSSKQTKDLQIVRSACTENFST